MMSFGLKSFAIRFVAALILVLVTYNPLEYSYFHWAFQGEGGNLPLKILAGLVLLVCYGIFFAATLKSIGMLGMFVVIIFFVVLLWVFFSLGWIRPTESSDFAWIAILILAAVLAIGMSWSGIWRRLTGQVTVDDSDDL